MKKIILLIYIFLSCLTVKGQEYYGTLTAGCDNYHNSLAPTMAIAVGVDANSYIGSRIEIRTGDTVLPYNKSQFFSGFIDVTNNLTNTIGLNHSIIDIILFGGVGAMCISDYNNLFALRYGVSCDIYIYRNDKCALFIKPTFNVNNYLINDKFKSYGILNLSLGLKIKI